MILTLADKSHGLTLTECLVTMAVIAILISQIMPDFTELMERQESRMSIRQLAFELTLTRNTAISRQSTVTLCPWNRATKTCAEDWSRERLMFVDADEDGRLDSKDNEIRWWPAMPEGSRVTAKFFGTRSQFSVTARGMARARNGTVLYCPPSGDPRHAGQIIVSLTGRTRLARDTDKNGIPEDSGGRDLVCVKTD